MVLSHFQWKESRKIVCAIIFNGLCGDLLNLWENVSSFVRTGPIHSAFCAADEGSSETPSLLTSSWGFFFIRWSISTRRHLPVTPLEPRHTVIRGAEMSSVCEPSLSGMAAEPSRSCCLLPMWRSGPLCYNERHMGLGPRITQRPYKLSSLSLPGGGASKQWASQSPFSRPLRAGEEVKR